MSVPEAFEINSPVEQNFSCNSCGKCCRIPWQIKVGLDKVADIEATEAYKRIESAGYQPLKVADNTVAVGRRDDLSCHFLNSGGCDIHREKGPESKPIVCQVYPFLLTNSPDGYFLSLSFTCPTVLEGTGEPLSAQLPEISQAISKSSFFQTERPSIHAKVAITQQREIAWSEYLALEQELLAVIDTDDPIPGLLRSAASLVTQAKVPGAFDWSPQALNPLILEQAASYFFTFAASAIAALECPVDEEAREKTMVSLLQSEQTESRLLNSHLPMFRVYELKDPTTAKLVKRYLENQILGKQLISAAPLVNRILTLAVSLAVLFFYLEVKTQQRPDSQVKAEDVAWCFELVESCLMSHSEKMSALFAQYELILLQSSVSDTPQ